MVDTILPNGTMDTSVKNKRVTMIKSVVGKVKTAQYALPDIVYGIESKIDKEGAGKGKPSILLPIEVSLSHSMFHIDSPFSFTHSNLFSH